VGVRVEVLVGDGVTVGGSGVKVIVGVGDGAVPLQAKASITSRANAKSELFFMKSNSPVKMDFPRGGFPFIRKLPPRNYI